MLSSLIAPLPMQRAGLYGAWGQLEDVLQAYCRARVEALAELTELKTRVRQRAAACHLAKDTPEGDDFDDYVGRLYRRVVDLRNMPVRAGLPDRRLSGAALTAYIVSRVRFAGEAPSLLRVLAKENGVACEDLLERCSLTAETGETLGETLERLEEMMVKLVDGLAAGGFSPAAAEGVMAWPKVQAMTVEGQAALREIFAYITEKLAPSLRPPSVRQAPKIEETADCAGLPSPRGWAIGQKLGQELIDRYIRDEGRYPETVAMILWEEANRRSQGQCVAEFLYLLGVRPRWNKQERVTGLEIIPARELRRPRIDVIGCVSGRFRRRMGAVMELLSEAVRLINEASTRDADNFVARHVESDTARLMMKGEDAADAKKEALRRLFLEPPADGNMANIPLILQWGLRRLDAVVKNEDTRATHMFCSDVYNACQGAVIAAVKKLTGRRAYGYVGDSSDPEHVQVRPLAAEARRLFWGEAVNPKFIAELRSYGAEGAYELAHYLERLCRWDETSGIMEDWMYEMAARLYVLNKESRQWMRELAPLALKTQCQLLLEATDRGRWQARGRTRASLEALSYSLVSIEEESGAARA